MASEAAGPADTSSRGKLHTRESHGMAERVFVVFGGGGVKGLAHAGAWKAIDEFGIRVSEIIGTSIGALVGACIAGGWSPERLAAQASALKRQDIVTMNRWAFLLNGISEPAVFRSDAFVEYLGRVLPVERFDEMSMPVSMNAVHLETGRMDWFGADGRTDVTVAEAVYASCALPLFYPPADIYGELYVDGGVRDALPVRRAKERGADLVIAIDVSAGEVKDSKDTVSKGMVAIHHRVFDIMAYSQKRGVLDSWSGPELIYIRPRLDGMSTFDFSRTDYFLEEGYRATHEVLKKRFGEPAAQRKTAG
jgi:NTE family protein